MITLIALALATAGTTEAPCPKGWHRDQYGHCSRRLDPLPHVDPDTDEDEFDAYSALEAAARYMDRMERVDRKDRR